MQGSPWHVTLIKAFFSFQSLGKMAFDCKIKGQLNVRLFLSGPKKTETEKDGMMSRHTETEAEIIGQRYLE